MNAQHRNDNAARCQAIADYWQQQYERRKQFFESEAQRNGYLAAAGRIEMVLEAEAMLEMMQHIAQEAAAPEARTRLRDLRDRYIIELLRSVGNDFGLAAKASILARKEAVRFIGDMLLRAAPAEGIENAL